MSDLSKGDGFNLTSEGNLLGSNHLDGITYKMLRQVKIELQKNQPDTSVNDALIYCIENTHEDLVKNNSEEG